MSGDGVEVSAKLTSPGKLPYTLTAVLALLALTLSGCGGSEFEDLQKFVKESGKGFPRKIDPLPEVKPYEAFTYNAFDLSDPFRPRAIEGAQGGGGGLRPDFNRRKEVLEAYPLESLKMVGTLDQKGVTYALIKAPDNTLHRVKPGNYLGQNFGKITMISEAEVKLTEIIQESTGDWAERESALKLLEEQEQKR